ATALPRRGARAAPAPSRTARRGSGNPRARSAGARPGTRRLPRGVRPRRAAGPCRQRVTTCASCVSFLTPLPAKRVLGEVIQAGRNELPARVVVRCQLEPGLRLPGLRPDGEVL